MNDLRFYVFFNSISVIQDDERLKMKGCVQWNPFTVKKILPQVGIELWTARSVGKRLTY